MTGQFKKQTDRKLNVNPELYHLLNQSSQRISIKSLDMNGKQFNPSNSIGLAVTNNSTAFFNNHSMFSKTFLNQNSVGSAASKQSFPEVVSAITNPFQKNNMNYAARNGHQIITPKMANSLRF